MGEVFLGTYESPAGRRRVAIKRVAQKGGSSSLDHDRLLSEARLVYRLTHTNICQVLDVGESAEGTFVVMEYVQGLDLRALLQGLYDEDSELSVANAVYVAREVARALDYAHRCTDDRGRALVVVHGDVTPQNILLSVEGEVKLADFGIARAFVVSSPGTGLSGGTPGYVAPEARSGVGDHRTDIWALGASLVVALTGWSPTTAVEQLGHLRAERPDVSGELYGILERALASDVARRYATAGELERALSVELARRTPDFTPSSLAGIVRRYAVQHEIPREPAQPTIVSLLVDGEKTQPDQATADERPGRRRPKPVPPSQTGKALLTQTVAGPRRRWWLVGALALVALGSAAFLGLGSRHIAQRLASTAAPTAEQPVPPTDVVEAPPKAVATAGPPANAVDAAPEAEATTREGGEARAAMPLPRRHPARAKPKETAFITVESNPWGAVAIDGRNVAKETPLYRFSTSTGRHLVRLRFPDAPSPPPQVVHLVAGQTVTIGCDRNRCRVTSP